MWTLTARSLAATFTITYDGRTTTQTTFAVSAGALEGLLEDMFVWDGVSAWPAGVPKGRRDFIVKAEPVTAPEVAKFTITVVSNLDRCAFASRSWPPPWSRSVLGLEHIISRMPC